MGRDAQVQSPCRIRQGFNPRARMGRDLPQGICTSRSECFNPRARMGRDSSDQLSCPHTHRFNPRARMGRDEVRAN